LGIDERFSAAFLVGTWKCTDDYHRWGVGDRGEAHTGPYTGNSLMTLNADGTVEMINFFVPERGRWKLTEQGLVLDDPASLKRQSQAIAVRKRGKDRIWLMLPFAGGAVGLGMSRVPEADVLEAKFRAMRNHTLQGHPMGSRSTSRLEDIRITDIDDSDTSAQPSDRHDGAYPGFGGDL
jgi:hypothetical protein